MKTRAQHDKTELRTRTIPKRTQLEVYVEVPPLRRSRRPAPSSTLSSASQAPSQPLNRVQTPPRVFTPPPPPAPHATPVAPDSRRLPSPSLPPSPQVENSSPVPLHPSITPVQVEASRRAPASTQAPLPLSPQADASQPVPAVIPPLRQTPSPAAESTLPASALPPALPRGPPPIPPPWTRPQRPNAPLAPEPTRSTNLLPSITTVAPVSSTANAGASLDNHLIEPVSVPRIGMNGFDPSLYIYSSLPPADLTQLTQHNRFDNGHLRRRAAQPILPVHVPPVDQLFEDDVLPPSSPPNSLPDVSSPVRSNFDDDALSEDVQPSRSSRSRKSIRFAADDEDYQQQEERDLEVSEEELEEEEAEKNAQVAQKARGTHSSRSQATKLAPKRQPSKGKGKQAKSTAKPAPKPSRKVQKGKKLSLYEDDDDDDDNDSRDPEDDPDAPQYEPDANKYTRAPGPLSRECLAEVNQLVYEFDTKMNAIGRKYHKSVASLWDAANMSKAGGVRELSTWNAFLAYRTKQEGAKANPGETSSDFVVRLGEEYKELMQELLGEDWQDTDQRRQVAKDRGWLDFVQESRLEATRDERENGVKKSTMQRCINEILKLGRLYYKFYGLVLSGALYDLNNHNRSRLFGYGAPYERVMTSEQVAFTKELKSMSARLRVAKDQEEKGLEGKAVIQHLITEYRSNPRNTDHLRKLYAHIFNEDINEATEGERSKIKYGDFYKFAHDQNVRLTHWPAGLLVDKLCSGEFPNAKHLGSDNLKDILSRRISYWEALLKRVDLRNEEEQRIVSKQDMGPRVVAWSKEEVLTHWRDQPKIPLIIDDEETVLLTVRDVSRLKAQKNAKDTNNGDEDGENTDNDATDGHTTKDKGKGRVVDDGTMNSDDEDDDDDEVPPRPPPR
ncbi:hypothetical protein VKT23_013810 [Stygiomarasmius scandens]|uniref:Uncharacterized protein n=1 Tax=Marasmiellus scandens TaxID=2682957 RepID=A0ABR1J5I9_9AGAR